MLIGVTSIHLISEVPVQREVRWRMLQHCTVGTKSKARAKSIARGPFAANCGRLEKHF